MVKPEAGRSDVAARGRSFIESARRAQIIATAAETIAELGYTRASLTQIAQRARVSKGVICYYFASKDELIGELYGSVLAEATAFMLPRIERESTARGRLRTFIHSNLEYMDSHRSATIAIAEIAPTFRTKTGELRYDSTARAAVADVEKLLRAGQRGGEFRRFPPRVMAVTIRAAIDAVPKQLAAGASLDLPSYAQELARIFDRATRLRA